MTGAACAVIGIRGIVILINFLHNTVTAATELTNGHFFCLFLNAAYLPVTTRTITLAQGAIHPSRCQEPVYPEPEGAQSISQCTIIKKRVLFLTFFWDKAFEILLQVFARNIANGKTELTGSVVAVGMT